jgi:hypothetical protein
MLLQEKEARKRFQRRISLFVANEAACFLHSLVTRAKFVSMYTDVFKMLFRNRLVMIYGCDTRDMLLGKKKKSKVLPVADRGCL